MLGQSKDWEQESKQKAPKKGRQNLLRGEGARSSHQEESLGWLWFIVCLGFGLLGSKLALNLLCTEDNLELPIVLLSPQEYWRTNPRLSAREASRPLRHPWCGTVLPKARRGPYLLLWPEKPAPLLLWVKRNKGKFSKPTCFSSLSGEDFPQPAALRRDVKQEEHHCSGDSCFHLWRTQLNLETALSPGECNI